MEVVLGLGANPTAEGADRQFSCKQTAKYAGLAAPKITKLTMWYNRKSVAAIEPTECA